MVLCNQKHSYTFLEKRSFGIHLTHLASHTFVRLLHISTKIRNDQSGTIVYLVHYHTCYVIVTAIIIITRGRATREVVLFLPNQEKRSHFWNSDNIKPWCWLHENECIKSCLQCAHKYVWDKFRMRKHAVFQLSTKLSKCWPGVLRELYLENNWRCNLVGDTWYM